MAAAIRLKAQQEFGETEVGVALARYTKDHGGMLPNSVSELAALLPHPEAARTLDRYEMLIVGSAKTLGAMNRAIGLKPSSVVDPYFDQSFWIGSGGGTLSIGDREVMSHIATGRAEAAYANAHNGDLVFDLAILAPYFQNQYDAQVAINLERKRMADFRAKLDHPQKDD